MKPARKYLSVVFVALSLLTTAAWSSTPTQESTGEYIDDSVVTSKVKAAILNEPTLKVAEINVETFKGVVQLSGFVRSEADSGKAGQVAQGVKGVKAVRNDLRVK